MKRILLFLAATFSIGNASAQGSGFESLQANSSPAYVILGVDPENISRPGTPRDFVAGAQTAIVDGKLQPNFALETSPYYWAHPKKQPGRFSAVDFVTNPAWGTNLLRSITLSFATSATDSLGFGTLEQGTGISGGLHLQLVSGRLSRTSQERLMLLLSAFNTKVLLDHLASSVEGGRQIDDVETELRQYIRRSGTDYQKIVANLDAIPQVLVLLGNKATLSSADLAVLEGLITAENSRAGAAQQAVLDIRAPLSREGFMLELSAATGIIAGANRWDRLNYGRTAIWLTPSYRMNINRDPSVIDYLDVMAVVRMTLNNPEVDQSSWLDGGVKLQWIHNRVSVAGEGVYRYALERPEALRQSYTYRAALAMGYKVNDYITFKATMGTNFDGNTARYSDPKKMFAVGGFNFGFGDLFH